jgi:hypothetical protein
VLGFLRFQKWISLVGFGPSRQFLGGLEHRPFPAKESRCFFEHATPISEAIGIQAWLRVGGWILSLGSAKPLFSYFSFNLFFNACRRISFFATTVRVDEKVTRSRDPER